jgi:hypothetical protein
MRERPCPGCARLGGRLEYLEQAYAKLARTQGNHLEHAQQTILGQRQQLQEVASGPSTATIIGVSLAGAVVLVGILWATGMFDSTPKPTRLSHPRTEGREPKRATLGFVGDLFDVASKGAKFGKSIGLI